MQHNLSERNFLWSELAANQDNILQLEMTDAMRCDAMCCDVVWFVYGMGAFIECAFEMYV